MFNIIPAIDLLDEKVVRLKQGRYDDVTFYDYSPVELAQQFESAGATRLHVVDLNGARDGKLVHQSVIQDLCHHTSLDIEIGGGIRNQESVEIYLSCGVKQIIIGSLFISNFTAAASLASAFPDTIIAGIDAKQDHVATDGWETTSTVTLDDILLRLNPLPLHSVIYTDIAKDGMMNGPNLAMLSRVAKSSSHPVIASGGIRHRDDVQTVRSLDNISGCIIGKAILSNSIDISSLF